MAQQNNHQVNEVSLKVFEIELSGRGKWGIIAVLALGLLVTMWLSLGIS